MAPTCCIVKGCHTKSGGDVCMHSFPNDPAQRQMWVDFVRRDRNWDWTPAKRSRICSLHFGPDCYRAGNHRYLLEFGIELSKKQYLEPEAVPTLYVASAKHRDASPASEPTCKRLCCEVRMPVVSGRAGCNAREISVARVTILTVKCISQYILQESRVSGTSCESPYEPPIVDETSQFSSPDSQVPSDSDSVIAMHMAASPQCNEKHNAQTQCDVQLASKATQTSATTKMQSLGVQAVQTSAEIGMCVYGAFFVMRQL
ncbi:THAP domain-containing protein 10-like isoform X1 [Rhipicephalus sanguineus]|uniref:THAP domain-containing protein 10-like isoform X1 n=1 Tax=Rhipicephalus sanguineus TaxID=34632 RepID=UPI0020C20C0F|nr:THAP domain-containing protein 10-like isoform X1 [Rhipicephalus sanguineus]XP_049267778.1 THAP domain-containing protein 10-like isoform X1 [Rhipicephalus sanguineus]